MLGLSGFFKNIQNAFTKEVVLRTAIQKTIKNQVGLEIPLENIVCKNGVVGLKNVNSSALSAIFIKKEKIIKEIKEKEQVFVVDIR